MADTTSIARTTSVKTGGAPVQDCNCAAIRQAARHVTQFYDETLAPSGLRTSQFSILARLARGGPMNVNSLAAAMVMDRTTLGRNILPLQRDGLLSAAPSAADRRSKELKLTPEGAERFRAAARLWADAQARFEARFGRKRAASLRGELRAVVTERF